MSEFSIDIRDIIKTYFLCLDNEISYIPLCSHLKGLFKDFKGCVFHRFHLRIQLLHVLQCLSHLWNNRKRPKTHQNRNGVYCIRIYHLWAQDVVVFDFRTNPLNALKVCVFDF